MTTLAPPLHSAGSTSLVTTYIFQDVKKSYRSWFLCAPFLRHAGHCSYRATSASSNCTGTTQASAVVARSMEQRSPSVEAIVLLLSLVPHDGRRPTSRISIIPRLRILQRLCAAALTSVTDDCSLSGTHTQSMTDSVSCCMMAVRHAAAHMRPAVLRLISAYRCVSSLAHARIKRTGL